MQPLLASWLLPKSLMSQSADDQIMDRTLDDQTAALPNPQECAERMLKFVRNEGTILRDRDLDNLIRLSRYLNSIIGSECQYSFAILCRFPIR